MRSSFVGVSLLFSFCLYLFLTFCLVAYLNVYAQPFSFVGRHEGSIWHRVLNTFLKKRAKTLGNGYVSHVYHLLVFLFPHPLALLKTKNEAHENPCTRGKNRGITDW